MAPLIRVQYMLTVLVDSHGDRQLGWQTVRLADSLAGHFVLCYCGFKTTAALMRLVVCNESNPVEKIYTWFN